MGYAIVDVETTGLKPSDDIVQLSALLLDENLRIKGFFNKYMDTNIEIPEVVVDICGVDNKRLKELSEGKTIRNYKDSIKNLLDGRVIIGHNISFDLRMIDSNMKRKCNTNINVSEIETIDTMKRYKNLTAIPRKGGKDGDYKYPKLEELVNFCLNENGKNIEYLSGLFEKSLKCEGDFHNSLFDCFCTYYAFITLK